MCSPSLGGLLLAAKLVNLYCRAARLLCTTRRQDVRQYAPLSWRASNCTISQVMARSIHVACRKRTTRLARRGRWNCARIGLYCRFVVLVVIGLAPGCKTTHYKAAELPVELRAAPAPASTGVNLERMAGAGVGTSQIGPGDLVQITIVSGSGEERIAPIPARVAQDGTVMVPLIGAVPVGGVEPVLAEQRIAAAAVERGIYRQPYVTLTVTDPAVNRITVLGAVAKPGVVELPRGSCDLASAIAAAGGLAKDASTRIEILRRGERSFLADDANSPSADAADGIALASYNEPSGAAVAPDVSQIDLAQAGPAMSQNRRLDDRDVVMVMPQEKQVIHVTGLVTKPNQFELPRDKDIRVLDALAMAGGTSSPVADKVFVIRQVPNGGQPAVVKVSISKAKRQGEENMLLTAGDLVSVESTPATMTVDALTKFFRIAFGLNGSVAAF
jgi:polysaccharide export outer membrane protein